MPHTKLVEGLAYILPQANPLVLFWLRLNLRNLTIDISYFTFFFLPFHHIIFPFTTTRLYYANCRKGLAPSLLIFTSTRLPGVPHGAHHRAATQEPAAAALQPPPNPPASCCSLYPPRAGPTLASAAAAARVLTTLQPAADVVASQEMQLRKLPSFFLSTLCLFIVHRNSSQFLLAVSSNLVCQYQMCG